MVLWYLLFFFYFSSEYCDFSDNIQSTTIVTKLVALTTLGTVVHSAKYDVVLQCCDLGFPLLLRLITLSWY